MDSFWDFSASSNSGNFRRQRVPPVLLIHGLFVAGDAWFLDTPNQSLGFILANRGFDVWVGNVRGTRWSQSHVSFSQKDREFWNWSWQELALYNLGEMVCYVYSVANSRVFVVGHSQVMLEMGIHQLNFKSDWGTLIMAMMCNGHVDCDDLLTSVTGKNCWFYSSRIDFYLEYEPHPSSAESSLSDCPNFARLILSDSLLPWFATQVNPDADTKYF